MAESKWEFITGLEFGDEDRPPSKLMLAYEKEKYKKYVLPSIKELKKELKAKGVKEDEQSKDYAQELFKQKLQSRHLTIKYENGDVYPKDVKPPNIYYIQEPEPHVLITGESDVEEDWYKLHDIIQDFAEEAFLAYDIGCWLASISSAINCCEYILKYELFRKLNNSNKPKLKKMLADNNLTFGKLINDRSYNCLAELGIVGLYSELDYLNAVRVSIYHNNQEKALKVRQRGELEVERQAPITNEIAIPIIAFRVYEIMLDLINHFYNKQKMLEYLEEGVADWKRKRNIKANF
ncbi:MAG: hypothetical protein QW346_02925 [Candidatus Micrarchaeaceae archaeon]